MKFKKLPLKFIVIIVIVILIISSSSYIIFFTGKKNDDNNGNNNNGNNNNGNNNGNNVEDIEPPTINWITGDTAGKKGEKIIISVTFSDNIDVTVATLYYRVAGGYDWSSRSILSGSVDILLASEERLCYYVTVDDAAGNGPVGDPSTDGSSYYVIMVLDDDGGEEDFVHTVFIEEATYTSCMPCTKIASIIDDLYSSGEYNFYYVSLVEDVSDIAKKRHGEYSVYGCPVVFIDGGYKILVGAGVEKSDFVNAIRAAELRDVPEINIDVTVGYNEDTNELSTTIYVVSNETEKYTGRLRVYLTEIISRWDQANTKPYHYAFLDYVINKEISIDGKGNITVTDKRSITEFAVPDLLPEELMIVAVIFSSESVKADSWPDDLPRGDEYGEFDAYFADATSATVIVPGGNLPPSAGISLPEINMLHIRGRPIWKFILNIVLHEKTVLIGKIIINANASDESGIEKVEFYFDEELKYTDEEAPYEYEIRKADVFRRFIRRHTIKIIAYDTEGKTDDASIKVITLFF